MDQLHYTILFQPEPEGGFTVTVPALPGCITYGRNLEEARRMATDAIGAYLASVQKDGEPIPVESVEALITSIRVKKPPRRIRSFAHA